jgi:23S rRNA (uracil1939-C5)-methyltransferase
MPLAKNSIVSVEIEDLAYGGLGVGRVDGFVVFVEKALPGDRVAARIHKKAKNHAQASIEALERPAPNRIAQPPCPLFGTCGGCTWQNLPYEDQARWKGKQVAATLQHLGKQQGFSVEPILPSPQAWRYRNKMEYTFGRNDAGVAILGFHLPRKFDRIFAVPACLIQPESFDAMLGILTSWARKHGLSTYDPHSHEGFLRHAVMRHSHTTGECLLLLITQEGDLPGRGALVEDLRRMVPGFKAMVWGIHCGVADVARIGEERWKWGEPELFETVNGLAFRISPQSFFQTNTAGAEILYAKAAEIAELSAADRVLDAYCGAGAIGLHCARRAGRVVGVESVTEAIWDARENARRNGIENATFIAAPLARGLDLARHAAWGDFTRVIIDPPRGGMDKQALRGLIELRAPLFLYVSCNPATLARDIETICEAGYAVDSVQPIDMFPHTYHVETLVRLRRMGN